MLPYTRGCTRLTGTVNCFARFTKVEIPDTQQVFQQGLIPLKLPYSQGLNFSMVLLISAFFGIFGIPRDSYRPRSREIMYLVASVCMSVRPSSVSPPVYPWVTATISRRCLSVCRVMARMRSIGF